ncbi:MAG: NUDIX hydrolase [Candidatus Uhrbacteria bacterium GW2011_GWD1_41_16]|uniref:NUDIX hydrolase n=1 Tax=Candidatus Uhrbacteria bacterium GW2011_GWC1_41_20 TaxID=1618983 RepID=A0A0G0XR77_9BACT|nr:MAG: NUDIX hydrolase [Candidatus Uhrbacteria bacterium GW2011_GWE1_39_46]KKR63629.1 MAG: NUDIX hydrolase [Candidatus Uhrbacteria bacterium GW2011_GWC2_40_450]KKR96401.1 MAG: NUDIX hydrolase [Candidatus Uhrbacteria bacterium GW2011_GWD1_41_16]KKR99415.1 MAG: NUDIX hydrolase [Candidatus Uhrbacteria bacterium GW2011_GWC1_41_20]KKS08353.1 MAG: NUDIX hydrolase [Candidatus Uhrbacteria bacterium GW2011_GWF2_41_40]KKS11000.1 MAG: NUDIX hydrolase [Candidatus Uhrbacteria bacterium GW2011_GWF2_41_430]
MLNFPLAEIDVIRALGFRPQIIGVVHRNGKVLFLYNKEYDLWMFAQGGIDNGETIEQGFWRELKEELGEGFVENLHQDLKLILKDESVFPSQTQGSRNITTDDGKEIFMKGKFYFAIAVESGIDEIDISKTEFNDYKWASFDEAQEILATIYQTGKRRILSSIVEKIKEMGLIG